MIYPNNFSDEFDPNDSFRLPAYRLRDEFDFNGKERDADEYDYQEQGNELYPAASSKVARRHPR